MKFIQMLLYGLLWLGADPVLPVTPAPVIVEPDKPTIVEDIPKKPTVLQFTFPSFPGVPVKDQTPAIIPPDPSVPPVLKDKLLYVVTSTEKFTLQAYPPGLLSVRSVSSPLNIYGSFWDEDGEDERTYSQPFIWIVKAVPAKNGEAWLVYTPDIDRNENTITSILIKIGAGPQPPPVIIKPEPPPVVVVPDVPPVIVPPVTPAPVGFRAMFISDPNAAMSREQLNTIYSSKIQAYLDAKCVKGGPSNVPEWRRFDTTTKITDKESKTISDLWSSVMVAADPIEKAKMVAKLPVIVIAVNGQAKWYPVEAETEVTKLLETAGGK